MIDFSKAVNLAYTKYEWSQIFYGLAKAIDFYLIFVLLELVRMSISKFELSINSIVILFIKL